MHPERFFDLVMELYYFLLKIAQDANTSKLELSDALESECKRI